MIQPLGRRAPALALLLLFGLASCSTEERQHLLTYEHPKPGHTVAAANPVPPPQPVLLEQKPPGPAPTQPVVESPSLAGPAPVTVQPEAPAEAPAPPPPPAVASAPPAASPVVVLNQPPAATPPPVATVTTAPPVIALRRPPAAVVSRHTVAPSPALVRPAPPPPETAAIAQPPAVVVPPPEPESSAAQPAVAVPSASVEATASPPAIAPAAMVALSAADEAHCRRVSEERERDAQANGYDEDMQQQILNGTWRNCIAWAQQHPGSTSPRGSSAEANQNCRKCDPIACQAEN